MPQEGGAKVAVISHNHPDSKPQREIRDFDPDPHITGNVDLSPPMVVKTEIVPWPYKHSPMPAAGVEKLNKAILGKCYSPPSSNLHVVIWMHNCKAFKVSLSHFCPERMKLYYAGLHSGRSDSNLEELGNQVSRLDLSSVPHAASRPGRGELLPL